MYTHKDNGNELYNNLILTRCHSLVFIANTVRCRDVIIKCQSAAFWVRENL